MHSILFVFGPARGGTTYLGTILGEWFDVGIGPEGTFIPDACRKAKRLGDLNKSSNIKRLAEYLSKVEMLEIIRKRYPQNLSFDVTSEDILNRMAGNSVADGIYAVFKAVADYRNKSRVGNKNPDYWKYLDLLYELFPKESYFIFIIRDGRDVALSLKQAPWGGHSIYEAALEWKKMIHNVESFRKTFPSERFLTVRYEDLLRHPADVIEKMGRFLQVNDLKKTVEDFVNFSASNEKKYNFNKWKKEMSKNEVEIFESLAGNELIQYGYERQFLCPKISNLKIFQFELERIIRLTRLNIYHFDRKLPQDIKKFKPSYFKSLFRPGGEEK